jgi:hypothetical protein
VTGYTTNYRLPYPEADTLISVSAPIVQELAEKIDGLMVFASPGHEQPPATVYAVAPYLVSHITTSGPWTPPAGVTAVDVVIVTGGAPGLMAVTSDGGWGGGPGVVRVLKNLTLTDAPIDITIGGPQTATTFGTYKVVYMDPDPWEPGDYGKPGPPAGFAGGDGIELTRAGDTSMWVAGGGGGGGQSHGTSEGQPGGAGGQGGGGAGGRGGYSTNYSNPDYRSQPGATGTPGYGGGGGGPGGAQTSMKPGPGGGGSGGVFVFAYAPLSAARRDPIDPVIMAALNDGVMVGAYAIDPVAPVDTLGALVPMPDEPQPTGETWTDEDTGETGPVLAWPVAGWTYNDGEWSPPDD